MKIALFTETFLPKIDGIVTRLRHTITELQRSGDEVLVFAPGEGIREYDGAQIERMPGVGFPLYPELTISFPRASIRQKLLSFEPDVIHVADPACLGLAGIYYADVLGLPLVISYHTRLPHYLHYYGLGALEPVAWKVLRLRHNKAAVNLCTSSAMASELEAHGVRRVKLWQRAVNAQRFDPAYASVEMREKLSEGHAGDPLFLYVGRLSAEKSIERLQEILQAIPGSRLALVGGGPHRARLERYFAGSATFFAGYLTGDDLSAAMASADALVLPSQTETLGLVLMEAMAAGTLVIGANAGGIPDVIQHEKNGLLFDPGAPAELSAMARRALDKTATCALRAQARQDAERWNWAASTKQLQAYYRVALQAEREEKPAYAHAAWMLALKKATIGGLKLFLS